MDSSSSAVPVIIIGGEIGWEVKEDDFTVEAIKNISPVKLREMKAIIKIYLPDQDQIREYVLSGLLGRINVSMPSYEDRQAIDAHRIAKLLMDHNVDFNDFHRILKGAAWDYSMAVSPLAKIITDMLAEIEGDK